MFKSIVSIRERFSPQLRKVAVNTSWLFADRILRMGVGLFVGVWVARYLGTQQFGLLNYATAFVALLTPFATLGLDNIVIREIVRDSSYKDEILGTTFFLKLLGGIVLVVLSIFSISLLRSGDRLTSWVVSVLSVGVIFQAFDTIDLQFQAQVQSKYTVIAKNLAFIVITLVKLTLIQINASLIAFAWVVLLESGLGAIGLAINYRMQGYSFWAWRWSLTRAIALLKESWALMLSGLTIMIYMRIDQIMLGQMIDDRAVGLYSAATRISEVWYFIPTAIASSMFPTIIEAKGISESLYYQRIKQLLRLMVFLSTAIAIPMTFLSKTFVVGLFGQEYIAASSILAIHIWASLFVFMGVATSPWFITEGLTKLSLQRTLIGAIANVLLNFLLIPTYSGNGAAIATVISYAFAAFIANLFSRKARKIFFIQFQALFLIDWSK
ncbi:flippase [Chroococcidiopsis thermalis]|jgi:polysaccharide transporter, PST family|uniref:Polysaccharide biosynthesis protein n=1 Tax=Chroococcidiopsis thermalis (strain PCC 7203) TaxID=251229 RepID=K9U5F8_CHRTP|nr:flippase [Chroococcidiopsis thermalis]AFY90070.1 polysaccharide biosynthesis protein [Chroococcidiopsis thermalis PCC 7203]